MMTGSVKQGLQFENLLRRAFHHRIERSQLRGHGNVRRMPRRKAYQTSFRPVYAVLHYRRKILSVRAYFNVIYFKSSQTFKHTHCITPKRVTSVRGPSSRDCACWQRSSFEENVAAAASRWRRVVSRDRHVGRTEFFLRGKQKFGGEKKIFGGQSYVLRQEMHEILLKMTFNRNHLGGQSKIFGDSFLLLPLGYVLESVRAFLVGFWLEIDKMSGLIRASQNTYLPCCILAF